MWTYCSKIVATLRQNNCTGQITTLLQKVLRDSIENQLSSLTAAKEKGVDSVPTPLFRAQLQRRSVSPAAAVGSAVDIDNAPGTVEIRASLVHIGHDVLEQQVIGPQQNRRGNGPFFCRADIVMGFSGNRAQILAAVNLGPLVGHPQGMPGEVIIPPGHLVRQ